ncbi:formate dehydrogenase, gamma subunit [Candidatus Kryptobacter tengchongensis]|nr:formate dehydrogenase, gamma subunit [Candidatus Kryptobacter tengchongensis]
MPSEKKVLRFSLSWRIQHFLLMVSVTLLIITGFALRYHDTWFGRFLIFIEGGFETRGTLHRISAVLLFITAVYHLIYILFTREGRKEFRELLPRKKDFADFVESIRYDIGKNEKPPMYGRYSYKEKIQYWAFFLFVILMILSGIVLWFHNYLFGILPKWFFDFSQALHSATATLVITFLVLWHLYLVHFSPSNFPINASFWHGYVSEEWLKENHYLEYLNLTSSSEEIKNKGYGK